MTTNYPTDPADILEAAADELQTNGWIKKRLKDVDGRHCAIGAMQKVAGYEEAWRQHIDGWRPAETTPEPLVTREPLVEASKRYMLAEAVLAHHLSQEGLTVGVGGWNDQPERTAEEVIDVMKHVAKDLRNRKEAA
jgi:hypothetical protein